MRAKNLTSGKLKRRLINTTKSSEEPNVVLSVSAEKLIMSHLSFVEAIAKKRIKSYSPVELDDLVQAGHVGLVEAAKRFDWRKAQKKGVKFTTYAYPWVNKYMVQEYLKARYPLHIPEKQLRKVSYGNRVVNILAGKLGRTPTYGELRREMTARGWGCSEREMAEVTRIMAIGERVYSLDQEIGDGADITFADVIPNPDRIEDTLGDVLPEEMNEVLLTLTPKEQRVLEIRYGIGTGQAYTLEEAGKEFNLSRESIRRIEAKAIRKLRHPSRSRKLKDFLQ